MDIGGWPPAVTEGHQWSSATHSIETTASASRMSWRDFNFIFFFKVQISPQYVKFVGRRKRCIERIEWLLLCNLYSINATWFLCTALIIYTWSIEQLCKKCEYHKTHGGGGERNKHVVVTLKKERDRASARKHKNNSGGRHAVVSFTF